MTRLLIILGTIMICGAALTAVEAGVEALSLYLGSSDVSAAYRSGGAGGITVSFLVMWLAKFWP